MNAALEGGRVGATIAGLAFNPLKASGRSMDGFDFSGTRTRARTRLPGHGTGAGRVVGVGSQQPMWRIGSQTRPSLMMMPCAVGLDAEPCAGR